MKHLLFLTFLCFGLAGCSPLHVVRLEPDAEITAFRYGEKIVAAENSQALVEVSYYDSSPKYLVFNLEVENIGEAPFNFDPVNCLLVPDVGPVQAAIDPEMQLLSMDIKSVQQARASRTIGWVGAGVVVVGSAVAIANGGNDEASFAGDFFTADAVFNVSNFAFSLLEAQNRQQVQRNSIPFAGEIPVPANRFFWLDHALRLTTLQPGQRITGKVAFARNDEAGNFSFTVRTEGEEFSFPFRQRVFKP